MKKLLAIFILTALSSPARADKLQGYQKEVLPAEKDKEIKELYEKEKQTFEDPKQVDSIFSKKMSPAEIEAQSKARLKQFNFNVGPTPSEDEFYKVMELSFDKDRIVLNNSIRPVPKVVSSIKDYPEDLKGYMIRLLSQCGKREFESAQFEAKDKNFYAVYYSCTNQCFGQKITPKNGAAAKSISPAIALNEKFCQAIWFKEVPVIWE